ncbi:hypothetical protein ACU610_07855 [Geodermatophilus sp. URMC 61]|uniref:hypothetical protein n=1 Tax=Geodermatophilus sp. URMC 61 TaxID=3423411 RepID=UPI00406C0A88
MRDPALRLSDLDGARRHPEQVGRRLVGQVLPDRRAMGEERPLVLRLHDLRHTRATQLLADDVPREVVSRACSAKTTG